MEQGPLINLTTIEVIEWDLKKLKDFVSSIPADNVPELLSKQDGKGNTPLIDAIQRENVPMVKYLLEECHVDSMVRDRRLKYSRYVGRTPLHVCCEVGNVEIIKILDENGATNREIFEGLTPLQHAALNFKENIISYYSGRSYYTRKEVCDCYDLLGVESFIREDLPSAIRFWNKALADRPNAIDFKSAFLEGFQRNSQTITNYDHLAGDLENAAIHSLLMLEKVLGIDYLKFYGFIRDLLQFIPITNTALWETILKLTLDRLDYCIFNESNIRFTLEFKKYILHQHFKNINSSILNIFYNFVNNSLKSAFLNYTINAVYYSYPFIVLAYLCLCAIKENIVDFDMKWFQTNIKKLINSKTLIYESIFHILIEQGKGWGLPDRVVYELFEISCKIAVSVNYLNYENETPLHEALKNSGNDEFIRLLLKYEAVTDTKNYGGESTRKLAKNLESQDICVGPCSLQILINSKIRNYNLKNREEHPRILKVFTTFH